MRKCELLALKKNNFVFRKILNFYFPRKLFIISSKTNRTRAIELDFKISLYFMFYLKNLEDNDLLFNFSSQYVSNNFIKVFKSSENKKNIKKIRFADIRHIHASYLLANNKNKANCIKIVQERLRTF